VLGVLGCRKIVGVVFEAEGRDTGAARDELWHAAADKTSTARTSRAAADLRAPLLARTRSVCLVETDVATTPQ
jgi:hypothetical protein